MPFNRRTRFFGEMQGCAKNGYRASADIDNPLHFEGGGWGGFVHVDLSERYDDHGDLVDWVVIRMRTHPRSDCADDVEIYSGPCDAARCAERKRKLRRRRAYEQGKIIARSIINKTTEPIPAVHLSGEDPFYYDESPPADTSDTQDDPDQPDDSWLV